MHKVAIYILMLIMPVNLTAAEQHAIIQSFQISASANNIGAAGYKITGTIHFEISMDDFIKSGDSADKTYFLTIQLKEGSKTVNANPGFEKFYSNESGEITLATQQKLMFGNVCNYDFIFFVPASALNLSEGQHLLTPIIKLTDQHSVRSILHKGKEIAMRIYVPEQTKIKIWVKRILVDSLDADGNLWDYFIFNPIESNPDIIWSINYAGHTYYTSKVVKNTFEYSDKSQTETQTLTICRTDTVIIEVKDKDDLTPDDIIGTLIVPLENLNKQSHNLLAASPGQIKSMEYEITVVP